MPIRDVSVLSRIYTPGVGAVCKEIAKNPASSYRYTCRGNSIALISDGSQVYEFGNIGAAAGDHALCGINPVGKTHPVGLLGSVVVHVELPFASPLQYGSPWATC